MLQHTFLGDQTLASGWEANHDNTNPSLLGLDATTISLSIRTHHLAIGDFAHLGLVLLANF